MKNDTFLKSPGELKRTAELCDIFKIKILIIRAVLIDLIVPYVVCP